MESSTYKPLREFQLRLLNVRSGELFIADTTELEAQQIDIKTASVAQLSAKKRIKPQEQTVEIRFTVTFSKRSDTEGDEPSEPLLKYTTYMAVEIVNFSAVIKKGEGDNYSMDGDLLEMLLGELMATTRGMLIEKTANTYFRDFYIPLLDRKQVTKTLFLS